MAPGTLQHTRSSLPAIGRRANGRPARAAAANWGSMTISGRRNGGPKNAADPAAARYSDHFSVSPV